MKDIKYLCKPHRESFKVMKIDGFKIKIVPDKSCEACERESLMEQGC